MCREIKACWSLSFGHRYSLLYSHFCSESDDVHNRYSEWRKLFLRRRKH